MTEALNAVEIKNLVKLYGANKALNDISFSVKKGEIMGFLGPNGAGKSTTMNIICGCISANSGSVSVCGCDVLENPKIVKGKIGYLPETPPLYFDMTVGEYLEFVFELKKVKLAKKEHIAEVMELVKISDMKNRVIKNLSKGYKQRVGLAQALIGNPEVLILDEPTVGLDPKQIIEIRNVIKEIGKQRTIILSTHILQEVEAVCDRVTIISHGKIVAQNTIEGLEEETGGKDTYLVSIIGNKEKARVLLRGLEGVSSVRVAQSKEENTASFIVEQIPGCDIREALTKAVAANDMAISSLRSAKCTLEEVFIKLTNAERVDDEEKEEVGTQAAENAEEINRTEENENESNI